MSSSSSQRPSESVQAGQNRRQIYTYNFSLVGAHFISHSLRIRCVYDSQCDFCCLRIVFRLFVCLCCRRLVHILWLESCSPHSTKIVSKMYKYIYLSFWYIYIYIRFVCTDGLNANQVFGNRKHTHTQRQHRQRENTN